MRMKCQKRYTKCVRKNLQKRPTKKTYIHTSPCLQHLQKRPLYITKRPIKKTYSLSHIPPELPSPHILYLTSFAISAKETVVHQKRPIKETYSLSRIPELPSPHILYLTSFAISANCRAAPPPSRRQSKKGRAS